MYTVFLRAEEADSLVLARTNVFPYRFSTLLIRVQPFSRYNNVTNITQYTSAQSFLFLSKATCFD